LQTDLFWLEKIMEDSFPLQKVFFCYDIALMKKYVFKPYSKIFPLLFDQEKLRLASHLKGDLKIEHVGSTAVSQLEGKGIIDIAIAVDKKEMDSISKQLQELGYEFRPNYSTPDRLYFIVYLPDPEEGKRRYHIHLTYPESQDWKDLIFLRDYLRSHPEEAKKYGELKEKAANESNEVGEKYRMLKDPLIREILEKNME
jgi:GrpB-like predicted nucleotidyltransferase (UPF0157 family)